MRQSWQVSRRRRAYTPHYSFSHSGPLNERLFDSEEEAYFSSTSNDDDESSHSMPLSDGDRSKPQRPRTQTVPSQPRHESPLSALVDYDDDDDVANPSSQLSKDGKSSGEMVTPQQIQITPFVPTENDTSPDPEDVILEDLMSGLNSTEIPIKTRSTSDEQRKDFVDVPSRLREKRRRNEEEDEDEMLERLMSKSRRLSNPLPDDTKSRSTVVASAKSEDAPKKLKLRFSAGKALNQRSSALPPSKPGSKDAEKG